MTGAATCLVKRVTLEERGKIIIKVTDTAADTAKRLNFCNTKAAVKVPQC
jgi:hypothetical protein